VLIINWKDIKHPRAGGGTLYTHKLATYLVKRNYEVTLLTAKYPGCENQEFIDGINVLRLGNMITVYGLVPFKYLKDLKDRFDIIIDEINYIPWFTPLYVQKTPILTFIHQTGKGVLDLEVNKMIKIPLQFIEKITPFIYRNILTVTVSKSVKEELVKKGFQEEKVIVIPPGIDVEKYRSKLSEKADYPLILYVGRLTRYKGVEHLIRAAHYLSKRIPDLRVSIVGKGDYLKDLVKLRDSLGLRQVVRFHGYVSEHEKIRLMQKAQLLVNPSVREGFSIVVIEAGACGTPAIGTDTTGLRDSILEGKTGFLVPYGKPLILAEKIAKCLEPEVWADLSRNAQAWASKFDWSNTLPRFEKVISLAICT